MPVIQIYLPERVYLFLVREADRLNMGVGKYITEVLKNYVNQLAQGQVRSEQALNMSNREEETYYHG